MKASEIITSLVAIYAAAVSTFLFVHQYKRDKKKVKVTLEFVSGASEIQERFAVVRFTNTGMRPLYLAKVLLEIRPFNIISTGKIAKEIVYIGELVNHLTDGQSSESYFGYEEIVNAYNKHRGDAGIQVAPVVVDVADTKWRGYGKLFPGSQVDLR